MDDEHIPPTKPKTRGGLPAWVTIVVLLAFMGGLAGAWFYLNRPKNGLHLDDLRADAAAKLPAGTPKEEIKKWFEAKGFTAVGDIRDPANQLLGYRALVPNDSYMERAEIEIACRFDKDGKVTTVDLTRLKTRE